MKKIFFRIITLTILLSLVITPVTAETQADESTSNFPVNPELSLVGESSSIEKFSQVDPDDVVFADEVSRYIVFFEGDSLVVHQDGVDGLETRSSDSQLYLEELGVQRESTLASAETALGREIKVRYVYDVILNGVSVELTSREALELESLPGIRQVLKDTTEHITTDAGPSWIGAPSLWDGTSVPDSLGTQGEGILVGVLDTGINFDHPSFSDTPDDGYTYTWDGDYLGVCAPKPDGDQQYNKACNDKVVGAYSYTEDAASETVTPEDSDGHGSHTASTVAGNTVDVDFYGIPVTISGVAPHAQIISYDVCYPSDTGGSCAGEDSIAAVQQAIIDGVDVINYSISGGENPYNDPVELAFLEATGSGIVVSTSAGNSGPGEATVAHRSPWVLSTAATTHNRIFTTSQVDFSDPLYMGIDTLAGEIPFTTAVVASDVVYSGEYEGNEEACAAFPADFFAGSIALIKRGTCNFSDKINYAANAGATGVLIFTDDRDPVAMSAPDTTIPNVMLNIPGTFGLEIANWVMTQTDETVDISAFGISYSDDYADIMADFSSRGPNTTFDVLKPDVGAPGVEILAAVADSTIKASADAEYALYQGTSMASPHDAGSAALLYALHPDWTPSEIQSALMLTAYADLVKEDEVTPADHFDIGAGRIQLEMAGLTGLVMDETYSNYMAANPDEGGDVRSLNIPSLYNSQCVGNCSWTRTFTSVADVSATYTVTAPDWIAVTPSEFTIAPGATQEITIIADVSGLEPDVWQFVAVEFNTDDLHSGGTPISSAHIPAAVLPTTGNIPDWIQFDSYRDAGGGTLTDLFAVEITDLTVETYGFVKGEATTIQLAPDPTNTDAFDDLSQVWYTLIDLTDGAARAVAEITASTAPDVDLFWGIDWNEDGLPSLDELYQASATGTAFEYLSEWGFPAGLPDLWILVQNWAGSGAPEDDITLMLGVVPYDSVDPATMTVVGPETVSAGTPFELQVLWHDIETEDGDRLYGLFDAYADSMYAVGIGVTEVDVVRGPDDVVKAVDVEEAVPGDTATYTIEITNYTDAPVEYMINDVLPDGVTYVADSVTGGAVYDDVANAITWTGTIDTGGYTYAMTTSANDAYCTMPLANSGAYVDLEGYGLAASNAVTGEGIWTWTVSGDPITFYGQDVGNELSFTDDGYAFLEEVSVQPSINADIPDPAVPNNLLAFFWRDLVITYDAATNAGVSLANLTTDDVPVGHIIEMDDVSVSSNPAETYDIEMYISKFVDDAVGEYEAVFAYDNIVGPLDIASVGVENADGSEGVKYAYNDTALSELTNGTAICFDWKLLSAPPVVITFQVTVDGDASGLILNQALHSVDMFGAVEESAAAEFMTPLQIMDPKINEFSASTTGTDVEYVEVYGDPDTDYSAYTILEIEGDGSGAGVIDEVIAVATTDSNGFYLADLASDTLENGTISLLLVKDFTGAMSDDLDTDDDGVLDVEPWSELTDSVAVNDGGTDDRTYGTTELYGDYDGLSSYAPGGASRIPDGYDTESVTDWVRNDFDLAGIPGYTGTIIEGEAYNTPGEQNEAYSAPPESCGDPYTPIYEIQGSGLSTPLDGTNLATEGIVVGDFQEGGINGFFIQDVSGDGDPTTSDGIFVYAPGADDVNIGDHVRVRGYADEYFDLTQIGDVSQVWLCEAGLVPPEPAEFALPVADELGFEKFEGMYVTIPQDLVIAEYYNFDYYGEIVLTTERFMTYTAQYEPDIAGFEESNEEYFLNRITLDDGRTTYNPDPAIHPNGLEITMDNLFRGGDLVTNVTGVLDYDYGLYKIQPTQGADYTSANPRPETYDLEEGDVKVASFNVLNYFTTLDDSGDICGPSEDMECRGADTAEEFVRQKDKILAAMSEIDADIFGLMEIENDRLSMSADYAVADLVAGLNDLLGAGTYDYIATGAIGTDAIKVAMIYKPGNVTPVGDYAILDSSVDARFLDEYNRPVLAQTFMDNVTEEIITVAVNHLKSKGSACMDDPDLGDGQGNCNLTRLAAAQAEVDWLGSDPTESGVDNYIIIGDLNSYDKEDPIDAIKLGPDDLADTEDDYVDMIYQVLGEFAYSYLFDGHIGYLDYAMVNSPLVDNVLDVTIWHINADEPDLIDYDMSYKQDNQDALYAPDAFRSSDHDPVIITLSFGQTVDYNIYLPLIIR